MKAGDNPVKKKVVQAGIVQFEKLGDQAQKIMMDAMSRVKDIRGKQRDVVDQVVAEGGVSKAAFKGHLKERALQRKIDGVRAKLDDDDAHSLDQLKQQLGLLADTPLGAAALAAAEDKVIPLHGGPAPAGEGGATAH